MISGDKLEQRILALASRAKGFEAWMLSTESTKNKIYKAVRHLADAGKLHRAQLGHRTVLWFTSKEMAVHAQDHAAAVLAKRHEKASDNKPRMLDQGEAIIPAGVKITRGPDFVPRFQGPQVCVQGGRATR